MKNDDENNSSFSPAEISEIANSCRGSDKVNDAKTVQCDQKDYANCCDAKESSCCNQKATKDCCDPTRTAIPKKEGVATIEVVGPGCASCHQLHKIVQYVSPSLGIENVVIYLSGQEGIARMMELGVMQAPILVVNGKVAMEGYSPSTEKIKEAILEAVK